MNRQDTRILSDIYKASKLGMHATKTILEKSNKAQLKNDVSRQYLAYEKSAEKAGSKLRSCGVVPEDSSILSKAALWGAVRVNTLSVTEPAKISEMMINSSTMSIIDLTKKVRECENAADETKSFAKKFIDTEEKNIEMLAKYL